MMCTQCPTIGVNIALFTLGVGLAGLLVTALLSMRIRSHGHQHLSGVLKRMIVNYLQVSSLALKFNLVWPDSMQNLLVAQGMFFLCFFSFLFTIYNFHFKYFMSPP